MLEMYLFLKVIYMKCPNCNKEITDNAKFCRNCGTNIETQPEQAKCPKCGALNRQGATFCDSCGAKMSEYETPKDSSITSSTDSVSEKSSNALDLLMIGILVALIGIMFYCLFI